MIGAVHNQSNPTKGIAANQRNTTNNQFRQIYTNQFNQNRVVSAKQPQSQQYIEIGGVDIEVLAKFWNGLDREADGSATLTEADIAVLRQKYDMRHLSLNQRYELLLELNQKNVISYDDCVNLIMVPVELSTEWGESFAGHPLPAENVGRDINISLPFAYYHTPQNIYEEYENSAMEWKAKYNAYLKQYGEERSVYLEHADAFSNIADIFKILLD